MSFDPTTSLLAGMGQAELQAALTSAQQAYVQLMTGQKVATASYGQGDGIKSVTYTQAKAQDLAAFIRLLQAQLGMQCARRPVRFNFR